MSDKFKIESKILNIKVTHADIEQSIHTENDRMKGKKNLPLKCCSCPIANALKKYHLINPNVGTYSVVGENITMTELPTIAKKFVLEFDSYFKGQPFEFVLTVPFLIKE